MQSNILLNEINFKAIRSSGAGGQHVNKVSSKVVLIFNLFESQAFEDDEKERLIKFLYSRLSKDGVLQLSTDESRSQHQNKKMVIEKFLFLIEEGRAVQKPRKKTKPSRASILRHKTAKIKNSQKKAWRQKPRLD